MPASSVLIAILPCATSKLPYHIIDLGQVKWKANALILNELVLFGRRLRTERISGPYGRIFPSGDVDLAVDDHVFYAGGEHVRMLVSRLVGDCRGIKRDHVRVVSGPEQTSVGEMQALCGQCA